MKSNRSGRITSAGFSMLMTLIFAIKGFTAYSNNRGYLEIFGIQLSKTAFYIILAAFVFLDIITVINIFRVEKKAETTSNDAVNRARERNRYVSPLEEPCRVDLIRPQSEGLGLLQLTVFLNGEDQGEVPLSVLFAMETSLKLNQLDVQTADGQMLTIDFSATSGGHVYIHMKRENGQLKLVQVAPAELGIS